MSPVPFSPITVQRFSSSSYSTNDFHSMSMSMSMMPSSVNPITADIIASQSQDYVDEGLAEFQDQIQRLQGKTLLKSLIEENNPHPDPQQGLNLIMIVNRIEKTESDPNLTLTYQQHASSDPILYPIQTSPSPESDSKPQSKHEIQNSLLPSFSWNRFLGIKITSYIFETGKMYNQLLLINNQCND
jgi:hypothetical protein